MLKRIKIRNFKCLRDISIDLGNLTVFIGPNGTGKSSVIQALLVLKQSLGSGVFILNGEYISLGQFDEVVHVGSEKNTIELTLEGTCVKKRRVDFYYEIGFGPEACHFQQSGIQARGASLSGYWERDGIRESPPDVKRDDASISFEVTPTIGRPIRISGGHSGSNRQSKKYYAQLREEYGELTSAIENGLKNFFVVPGIRGVDNPAVELLNEGVRDFITSQGLSRQASNLASTLGYAPDIADKASKWTERLAQIRIRHRLVPEKKTSVEALNPTYNTNIVNEGLGINQIIFPFSQIVRAEPYSLIAIEEPEIHLHPKAQSKLMDIFVEICREEKKQMLLTTHSEHVLFRLLTNVARGDLSPEELSVYYFEKENTRTKATKLEVDKEGRLKGGLPGFFEEELKEFKDYLDALTKKG